MKLSMMVTFEDSVLVYGTWGRVGVWHILSKLKESGVSRVYWRSRGDGQTEYPSRITETKLHMYPDEYPHPTWHISDQTVDYVNKVVNFDEMDFFRCSRDRCAELGIEFCVWEETRGEDHGHQMYSSFIKRYPQFLSIRDDGERAWSELGWAFQEVMDRRVGLFREVISYEPDAVYFDFVKSGDDIVGRLDKDGYWRMGYEQPMLDAFRDSTGKDATALDNRDLAWLQFRADYVTDYLKRCKAIRDSLFKDVQLGVCAMQPKYSASHRGLEANRELAFYPEDPLGNLEDHQRWLDDGLVENFVIGHNCRCEFDVLENVPDQIHLHRNRLGQHPALNALQVETYTSRESNALAWLDQLIAIAESEGIGELILREATPMWPHKSMWAALRKRFAS